MSPIQLRMARAALNWTVRDLATRARVNKNTVSRYEAGKEIVASSLQRIEQVLIEHGIVFFEQDSKYGAGVRLKKRKRELS